MLGTRVGVVRLGLWAVWVVQYLFSIPGTWSEAQLGIESSGLGTSFGLDE